MQRGTMSSHRGNGHVQRSRAGREANDRNDDQGDRRMEGMARSAGRVQPTPEHDPDRLGAGGMGEAAWLL